MEISGIIAEYNPFHNGHRFQIEAVRERIGADSGIIVAMSGDFTQRGEPAILDKWTRAKIAVQAGADVVLELPFGFATASAERFASGGVYLMNQTGVIRHLAFGTETVNPNLLETLADHLAIESESFQSELKQKLSTGIGFAAARQAAVSALYGTDMAAILNRPNAILALSYLIAIRRQKAKLSPLLIERKGPGEHAKASEASFASASFIRERIFSSQDQVGDLLELAPLLPDHSLAALINAKLSDRLGSFSRFFPYLLMRLRTIQNDELAQIASMAPDLDKRLLSLVNSTLGCNDAAMFVNEVATRAYPAARVRRALIHLLLNYTEEAEKRDSFPVALKVLAFGKKRGRYILKLMRRHAKLPILSRTSDILELPEQIKNMLAVDLAASDLYALSVGGRLRADFEAVVEPI